MRARTRTRRSAGLRNLYFAAATLLALVACQQATDTRTTQQMAWAKIALERNPNLEIVATDMQAGVFTVRDRRTGEVQAVTLAELGAAPVAQLAVPVPAATLQSAAVPDTASPAQEATLPDAAPAEPAEMEPALAAVDPAASAAASSYTIERSDGRVKVSGPGVSIVSGDSAPQVTARDAPGQRTVEPIVCEGQRMMHLDDRDIFVDGDAITVRGGCELHITNSRIVASGTGVVVRHGVVHVTNSYVEGSAAAFDVTGEARLYLRGSVLQGLLRRDTLAMIQDQGGNRGLPTL